MEDNNPFSADSIALEPTGQQASKTPDPSGQISLLVFVLSEHIFALPIESVIQVIPMLKITPVPEYSHILDGVMNIHGQMVPVLAGRKQFHLPETAPQLHTPILLLRAGEQTLGLIVDEVRDVLLLPDSQLTPPQQMLPKEVDAPAVLLGMVSQAAETIFVLDSRHLMSKDQLVLLEKAIQALLHAESVSSSGAA